MNITSKKLADEIRKAEGKAKERLLTVNDLLKAVEELEKSLNCSKKALIGTRVLIDVNSQTFPKAYKYTPMSTLIRVEKTPATWKVIEVRRGACQNRKFRLKLSENAKNEIIENIESGKIKGV